MGVELFARVLKNGDNCTKKLILTFTWTVMSNIAYLRIFKDSQDIDNQRFTVIVLDLAQWQLIEIRRMVMGQLSSYRCFRLYHGSRSWISSSRRSFPSS